MKPKIIIAENVKGLVAGNAKGYVNEIIKAFESAGYSVQIFLLDQLAERNQMIVSRFYSGETITELSEVYYLSEKRIRGIIYEYESSRKEKDGGFISE